MSSRVSDEVWSELDPNAGRLGPRQRRRLIALVSVGAVVTAAGASVYLSGIVRPRVGLDEHSGHAGSASTDTKVITREVMLRNSGWTTVRVTAFGADGPGLHLVGPSALDGSRRVLASHGVQPPFDLQAGEKKVVVVVYQITDCAAVTKAHFPIPVHVDGFLGSQTIDVSLPRESPASAAGDEDAPTEEWQRAEADDACNTHP